MILQDEVEVKDDIKDISSESTAEPVVDAEPEEEKTSASEAPAALLSTDSPKDTDDFDQMEAQLDEQFQKLVNEYAGEEKSAEETEKSEPEKEKKGFRIRVRVKD